MYRYFTTLLNLNNICKDCNRCAFYTNSLHSQFLLSLCYQDHCKYICYSYLRGESSNKGGLLIQNEALGVKSWVLTFKEFMGNSIITLSVVRSLQNMTFN